MRIVLFFFFICTFILATFNLSFAQTKDTPYVYTNNAFSWYQYCESFLREAPIELHSKLIRDMQIDIKSIKLDYRAINLKKIIYTQNSLEFLPLGNYEINVDDTEYKLQKYYFISNSAFVVLGKQYLLETHFLYESKLPSNITKKPSYLVLIVFYDLGEQDIFIHDLVSNIPKTNLPPKSLSLDSKVNYISLDSEQKIIPDNINDYVYFEDINHYNTFCPTGVSFLVLKDPLAISLPDSDLLNSLIGEAQFSTNRIKQLIYKKLNKVVEDKQTNNTALFSSMLHDSERLKIDPEYYSEQDFLKEISTLDQQTKKLEDTCPKEEDLSLKEIPTDNNKESIPYPSDKEGNNKDNKNSPVTDNKEIILSTETKVSEKKDLKDSAQDQKNRKTNNGTLEKKYNESELLLKDFEDSDDTSDLY